MKEPIGFGAYESEDGVTYQFDYGSEKDIGLGTLTRFGTDEEYKVLELWQNDLDVVERVLIEIE